MGSMRLYDDGNVHLHTVYGPLWINIENGGMPLKVNTQGFANGGMDVGGAITSTGSITSSTTINSTSTIGNSFFYKVQTSSINTSFGTNIALDNLNVRIRSTGGSNGLLEASAISGSFTAYVTLWENIAGQPGRASTNSAGITFTSGTWTSVNANYQISSGGDLIFYHLMDVTNDRLYKVTCMHGQSATGGYMSIERML